MTETVSTADVTKTDMTGTEAAKTDMTEAGIMNVIGKPCPIPVIEAKKALRRLGPGGRICLVVDNDIARQNLQKMAEGTGCGFSFGPEALSALSAPEAASLSAVLSPAEAAELAAGGNIAVVITAPAAPSGDAPASRSSGSPGSLPSSGPGAVTAAAGLFEPDDGKGLVVAVGSDRMGTGEDELGRSLMKAFIYSLTELEPPPEYLLFFNGGIKLTTEGATTLADLQTLADKGVIISSCGACLNYYQLTDKLAVGSVTNMYAITTTMAQARRLINLS